MSKISGTNTTTVISYLAVFLNAIIGILITPFIIRELGDSQYGLYAICSSLIGFFLMDFGLGSAASRYISKYRVIEDHENEKKTISTIFRLFLFIDAIILLALAVVFLLIDQIYTALTLQEVRTLKIVFLITAFSSVLCFPFLILNGILTSYEKYVHIKIATIISKVFMAAAIVLVLAMNGGIYALVIVHAIESLLAVVYKLYIIRKRTGAKLTLSAYDKNLAKEIIQFSIWVTVMAVSHRLIFTVVPSILGVVSNTEEVAHFSVVLTIENYLYLISTAFSGMFMPKISRLYNEEKFEEKLFSLTTKVCKLIYGINILVFLGLLFLGDDFLRLWAGNGYDEVHIGLLMVVFPTMFYNTMEILNTAVMVKNKVKYSGLINLFSGVLNIIVCLIMSKFRGANGACTAVMLATTLRTVLSYVLYSRILHIRMKKVIFEVYVKTLPAVLIAALFGVLGDTIIQSSGWFGFIIRGAILVSGAVIGVLLFMRKDIVTIIRKGNREEKTD